MVYFGGRWYDPEIGRFITVDPAEDGANWYQYCRSNPVNYVDPDGYRIWFVHGTNSTHRMWMENFSYFTSRVAFWFRDDYDVSFEWGEKNNDSDTRKKAAKKLANKIKAWHMTHPGEPIRIVAHSHGGNVEIMAANMLGYPQKGDSIIINNLITISTPVLSKYMLKYHNVLAHNHIYNEEDDVQVNGGYNRNTTNMPNSWFKNIVISFIPKASGGSPGEYGVAGRTFSKANNIKVSTQSEAFRMRGLDAHSSIMAIVEEWIWQVEPKLRRGW